MTETTKASSSGWVTFAAVLFAVAGAGNIIWGLGALGKQSAFAEGGLIYGSLQMWGWIALIWGIVVLLGAVLLFTRFASGPPLGIVLAGISAVFWFFVLPVVPIFALAAIIVDVLVIYGLSVHGFAEEA